MGNPDPRIDAYIARQAEFARPILDELRRRVHAACPAAEEAIKWGAPAFTYNGKLLGVMALIDAGTTARTPGKPKSPPMLPDDLAQAMAANPAARATWDGFTPGKRRDYADWITEAKRDDTRARRVAQSVEWLAEGKTRHWKYQDC